MILTLRSNGLFVFGRRHWSVASQRSSRDAVPKIWGGIPLDLLGAPVVGGLLRVVQGGRAGTAQAKGAAWG